MKLVTWDRTGYCLFAKQLDWFKSRLFGSKSERRFVDPDSRRLALGEWKQAEAPGAEITIAEHHRRIRTGRSEADHEIVSEQTTLRLAQKPASYVVLKVTDTALEHIRNLYEAEAQLKPRLLDDAKRLELRALHCKPIVDAFFEWLKTVLEERILLPRNPFTAAAGHALAREKQLQVFLEYRDVPIALGGTGCSAGPKSEPSTSACSRAC